MSSHIKHTHRTNPTHIRENKEIAARSCVGKPFTEQNGLTVSGLPGCYIVERSNCGEHRRIGENSFQGTCCTSDRIALDLAYNSGVAKSGHVAAKGDAGWIQICNAAAVPCEARSATGGERCAGEGTSGYRTAAAAQ